MLLSSGPVLSLKPSSESTYFQTKFIFLQGGVRTVLGQQDPEGGASGSATSATPPRNSSATNGFFPLGGNDGLDHEHAEVWFESGKVFVRSLSTRAGTFVNGVLVTGPVVLQNGDVLALGPRNGDAPTIIAIVALVGV